MGAPQPQAHHVSHRYRPGRHPGIVPGNRTDGSARGRGNDYPRPSRGQACGGRATHHRPHARGVAVAAAQRDRPANHQNPPHVDTHRPNLALCRSQACRQHDCGLLQCGHQAHHDHAGAGLRRGGARSRGGAQGPHQDPQQRHLRRERHHPGAGRERVRPRRRHRDGRRTGALRHRTR